MKVSSSIWLAQWLCSFFGNLVEAQWFDSCWIHFLLSNTLYRSSTHMLLSTIEWSNGHWNACPHQDSQFDSLLDLSATTWWNLLSESKAPDGNIWLVYILLPTQHYQIGLLSWMPHDFAMSLAHAMCHLLIGPPIYHVGIIILPCQQYVIYHIKAKSFFVW